MDRTRTLEAIMQLNWRFNANKKHLRLICIKLPALLLQNNLSRNYEAQIGMCLETFGSDPHEGMIQNCKRVLSSPSSSGHWSVTLLIEM